jgi:hypothetical protein
MASALGRGDDATRLAATRDEFRADLTASLRYVTAERGISYLPGAADLGDFDPTSSTIAIAPYGELHRLPSDLVHGTFERYWREFVDRRDGRIAWQDYTPYEIRSIGTFVRLGWRDRAHELLAFFMAGRRPPAWNQWPEVVHRDQKEPRFIGDLPHAWIGSDFIRATLDLFAYERERDGALVLAGGVLPQWLEGSGVVVRDLRTPYGRLGYSLKREGERVVLQVAGGSSLPPGGLVLVWPGAQSPPRDTRINGDVARWDGVELRIDRVPATVVIDGRP